MYPKCLNEKEYFNLVAGIAILHDCDLVDLDFSKRIINVTGTLQAVNSYAIELEQLLGTKGESYACSRPI